MTNLNLPISVQSVDTINLIQEQIDLKSISTFRDEWVPFEYLPLPEWLVYVDLGILFTLMITGLMFVIKRKPSRQLNLLAILTLVILGIIRGGCICPMGLTTNVVMGLILPYMVSLVGFLMFIGPLIIALISGRVFCTAGCPLGAIQHLFYRKKKSYKLPPKVNKYLRIAPILVLLATIYFGIKGTLYLGCELDPYKPVFFTGKAWFEQGIAAIIGIPMESKILLGFGLIGWIYLLVALIIGYWVERPFCRLLCPYVPLLGLFSMVAWKRRTIDKSACTYCNLCVQSCPTQSIVVDKKEEIQSVSNYDCIQCNRCSDQCKTKAI